MFELPDMAKGRTLFSTLVLVIVIGFSATSKAADTNKICSSDVCRRTAQIMRSAMDTSSHPCQNFYQFACGNFMKNTVIPQGQQIVGPFTDAHVNQVLRVKNILNGGITSGSSSAQTKAMQFYKTCVGSASSVSQKTTNMNYLKQMLNDFLSGWPLTTRNWNSQAFDLTTTMARIASKLDQGFFVAPKILPDMGNSSKYTVTLIPAHPAQSMVAFGDNVMRTPDQLRQDPITGLPLDQGYSNYQQESLSGIIRQVACTIDPDCARNPNLYYDVTTLSNLLTRGRGYAFSDPDVFVLNKLNLQMKSNYATKEPEVERMRLTIPLLNRALPEINWQRYFNILFENTDFKVDRNFKVLAVYKQLGQLLAGFGQLTPRELALIIGWHLVVKYGKLFSPELLAFLSPGQDQSDVCLAEVNQVMGYAVGSMYNQKYVQIETINEVTTIVTDLKKSFREMLVENTWMDDMTKQTALRKIERMGQSVGGPDWTRDNSKLDQYYTKLTSNDLANFPTAFKKGRTLYFSRQIELLKRAVNSKDEWPVENTAMTNAMYFIPSNFMYYFSGMLQFPFYVKGLPRAVNFGAFGYVAGHEITHGFDTAGGNRNEFGEVENWWEERTAQSFMSRAQCFIRQYGAQQESTTGMMVNGELTLGENIADNGGIRAAFKAYKNISKEEGGRLYGLEQYTEDQLFFMSAALTYCTKNRPELMQMLLNTDVHSPNKYRALLPLLNSDDFAKAFNCPVNSPMNPSPELKCKLW